MFEKENIELIAYKVVRQESFGYVGKTGFGLKTLDVFHHVMQERDVHEEDIGLRNKVLIDVFSERFIRTFFITCLQNN